MDVTGIVVGVLLLFIGFVFGAGRRQGRQEGIAEGMRRAPLKLRQTGLEQGACVLCGAPGAEGVEDEERDVPPEADRSGGAGKPEGGNVEKNG